MIKNKTIIEIKIGERTYELMCSPDSPLGELHDALSQFKHFVIERIKNQEQNPESPKD